MTIPVMVAGCKSYKVTFEKFDTIDNCNVSPMRRFEKGPSPTLLTVMGTTRLAIQASYPVFLFICTHRPFKSVCVGEQKTRSSRQRVSVPTFPSTGSKYDGTGIIDCLCT